MPADRQFETSKVEILKYFIVALNNHDLDRIEAFFCDDCVFFSSAGDAPGGVAFRGKTEVRRGFELIFETFADACWCHDNHFVESNRGFSEWTFIGTNSQRERIEVRGCDAFVFQGDKIQVKDSFRKQV
ncbi:nuclear transport factor 2 family protein [Hoeflea sp.]|uniref:nuclear transport factor 2 family protein n=1 Tax=Hoeflea sp. TaxID=1940281 RepID=UPI003B01439E